MVNKNIIDIAVLSQEINEPYKQDDKVPIYDLVPKMPVLDVKNFIRLFYKNGISNNFCVNNDYHSLLGTKQTGSALVNNSHCKYELVSEPLINYISFKNQNLMRNDSFTDYSLDFNLINSIFSSYSDPETGIGVDPSCWTACSRIELVEQLLKICHLYDICNVCCSLTFLEALENIINDNNENILEDSIIKFRISVVFTNDNENIKDVIVRFNYLVDLESGNDCIPTSIYNKIIRNICDLNNNCIEETCCKGHIYKLKFLDNKFLFGNNAIKLTEASKWSFFKGNMYSITIHISNDMRIFSKQKTECYETKIKQNCILFSIRVIIPIKYFILFEKNGFIDSSKLCVELVSNTACDYSVGDTFNLGQLDPLYNIGVKSDKGVLPICKCPEDNTCIFPLAINILFNKIDGKLITFEDIDCEPLILSVCKIC